MICKGCIHYDCCRQWNTKQMAQCPAFKHASRYVEFPCERGDYCKWQGYMYYVTAITYIGNRHEFLLQLNSADDEPVTVYAPSSECEFLHKNVNEL